MTGAMRPDTARRIAPSSQFQIRSPSLIRKNVTKSISTRPPKNSAAILPPVTTVPSTRDLCLLR
jgi:hypothetical protein